MNGLNMTFCPPLPIGTVPKISVLAALSSIALAGCGGAGAEPTPYEDTLEGVLEDSDRRVPADDSPYDEYTFEAGAGWLIEAELKSTEFDSYLWLIGPGGQSLQQVDDTPRQGLDAHVRFTTELQGTYILRANSRDGTGRGAYTLHVRAAPAE